MIATNLAADIFMLSTANSTTLFDPAVERFFYGYSRNQQVRSFVIALGTKRSQTTAFPFIDVEYEFQHPCYEAG
ncbi:MAG: hypothetical protein ACPGXK_04985 [Phycisphaerae bacterium]